MKYFSRDVLVQHPDKPNYSTMQFPQEIDSHIAGFITDEVRATDPHCYRSARSMQAAWRGWLTRQNLADHAVCDQCGEYDGQPHHSWSWTCEACRLDYMIEAFEDGAVSWGSFTPGCPYP